MMKWLTQLSVFLVVALMGGGAFAAPVVTNLPENRILLFNDYALSNTATQVNQPWVLHDGPLYGLVPAQRAMLPGTNHFHRTGWRLISCRAGTVSAQAGARIVPPVVPVPTYPLIASNLAANLRNDLGAYVESPVLTNGAGTVYFEAINAFVDKPTEITVEISTNLWDIVGGTNVYTLLPPSTNGMTNVWQTLVVTNLSQATSNDFIRYASRLDCRVPSKLRIRRSGSAYSGIQEASYTVVDNVRISPPPTDVSVYDLNAFNQAGNFIIRGFVSNVDTNVPTDSRTVTAHFRWANLTPPANAWTNIVMELKDAGDGNGNGERYELVLPPQILGGDLEYYIVCDFSGYAYQSPDYTGMGYAGYLSEAPSPFTTTTQSQHLAGANLYNLTVESGTGSGAYTNNQTVAISASNLVGKGFAYWTGATQFVADAFSSTTTLIMPNFDIAVTANYTNSLYTLIVNGGSGGGLYEYGQTVPISADTLAGKIFDRWTGATQSVSSVVSPNTTVTMPASNITLTASYLDVYTLAVTNGTGSGSYTNGQRVAISADAPLPGKRFLRWTGHVAYVDDASASSTFVTMQAFNMGLTATYVDVYTLTVNSGSGGGTYTNNQVVAISANAPAPGTIFFRWVGDVATVANVTSATTTVTIPTSDIVLTATYLNVYTLTVNSGSGSGTYTNNQEVAITATAPAVGKTFARWTGATQHVVNALAPSTAVIMPPSNIVVTATYSNLYYMLTVNGGSGGGFYTNGQIVAIAATVPADKTFDKWSGDTGYLAGGIVTSATTTVTMPAANITLTALLSSQTSVLPDNRFLHFNDYLLTNAPNPVWTHDGPLAPGILNAPKALLAGTNHFHRTGWRLINCRAGTVGGYSGAFYVPPFVNVPPYPAVASNLAANLRNDLGAMIDSPVLTNGVGTLYFEAVNGSVDRPTQITVSIATNMYDVNTGTYSPTLLPEETENWKYDWRTLSILQLAAATSNDFTRYNSLLNFRNKTKLRISRTGDLHVGVGLDAAFTVIDNLRVSLPPSDVIMSKTEAPFEPGYPAVQTNVSVRCYISNADTNVPTDTRSPKVVYRWRFLNQEVQAWRTNDMSYVAGTGDGQGNGEQYQATLSLSPFTEVGDLEYYFICEFGGYVYVSPDYTGMKYTGYPSENLSPRFFGSASSAFTVRLRPYASRYNKLYLVADVDQFASPIEMSLVGDNEWRGMVPIAGKDLTELTWRFKAEGEYVAGSGLISTGVTWWAGVSGDNGGRMPYGGLCVETNASGRLTVQVDKGNYVLVTFNTEALTYLACRGEYQSFNGWPAPPNFFSESNGQDPKSSYLNTFDGWATNDYQTFIQAFAGYPPTTNVFTRDAFTTLNPEFMAGSAAYVSERTMVDNTVNAPVGAVKIRNVAMRLKGGDGVLGLGYLYNRAATLPDGLKDVTFKGRLGQTSDNYDIAYYRYGFTNFNYLVRGAARAIDKTVSPQNPSVSLVGYYTDPDNFYEYRVVQVNDPADTAANQQDKRVSHQLYKWKNGVATRIGTVKEESVTTGAGPLVNPTISDSAPLEMAFFNETTGTTGTRIVCRFGNPAVDKINYVDPTTSSPHTKGTFGYLSEECASQLFEVRTLGTISGAIGYGTQVYFLRKDDSYFGSDVANWYLPAGRYIANSDATPKGIYSVTPVQQIGVYVQPTDYVPDGGGEQPDAAGSSSWVLAKTLSVTNYTYQTLTVPFNSWRSEYVMLQVLGGQADAVVDEVSVSSWHGQRNGMGWADVNEWVAYESWVVSNATGEAHTVYLDHTRGDPAQDQSIRSLLLETGMGLMEFDYRVLRAPAKLTVQYAPERDVTDWSDVESFVITNTTVWQHAAAYLGTNAPGYFRLVNAREGLFTNAWVEVDNATVWDEPSVTNNSWRAYNVKITSTDTNRVALDQSEACFFNNDEYLETDPPQTVFEPYLRSPELPKGFGKISFYARAYTNNQAATLYLYASTNGWNAPTNLWFELTRFSNITNGLYKLFTYEMIDGRHIDAVKLGTMTRPFDRRVCVEDVTIFEPVFPGFSIENVQLIDLVSGDGQPTEGEEVHVQAQITNIQMAPSNIEMYVSYYVGSNHWGIGNWPAGEYKTLRMTNNVPGDPTLYRTVAKGTPGFPSAETGGIPGQERDQVVQYYVWAKYVGGVPLSTQQETFTNPEWYYPVDLNERFAAQGWSPYYIVYGVPLHAVFINEINAVDWVEGQHTIGDNAYIEIAVPSWVDLAGWSVELVANNYSVITIPISAPTPEQTAVTNGYAFFVIADVQPSPGSGLVPLPKVDLVFPYLNSVIPFLLPGGLRLKRPMGMYEHSCAYNYTNSAEWGSVYSGEEWAAADPSPHGRMVYVGTENCGGSLGVISGHGQTSNEWYFPMTWTPGSPNVGQIVPPKVNPGSQSVYVTSVLNSDKATQNGQRISNYTIKVPKSGGTNIVYRTDPWYRLFSVKQDLVEQLPSLGTSTNFNLVLFDLVSNVEVNVDVGLRSDLASMNLDPDVLNWVLGFPDRDLVPMYYNNRQLTLTEQYWLNADPTRTNIFELASTKFTLEPGTNFYVTVKMAVNDEKRSSFQGGAVLKLEAKGLMTQANWEMLAQYTLTAESFDANNSCRLFVFNPFLFVLSGWDPKEVYFRWVVELSDPRVSTQVLINTPEP